MSLKIWLPLTKENDISNHGLDSTDFTVLSSTTSYNANGKLGGCYRNTTHSGGGLYSREAVDLGEKQSMFCWCRMESFYASSNLTGIVTQHDYSKCQGLGLTLATLTSTTGKISITEGDGSNRTYNTYTGNTVLNTNTWYHLGFTYDGTTVTFYVNGIVDGTVSLPGRKIVADNIEVFAWSKQHPNYNFNGSINDVRIYDHCLSQKEVSEIANGLVLHYRLDQIPNNLENLAYNTTYNIYNNAGNSVIPSTLVKLEEKFMGCDIYRLTMTPTSSGLGYIQSGLWNTGIYGFAGTFLANTKYCFSICYRVISSKPCVVGGSASNIGGWAEIPDMLISDEWHMCGQYRDGSVTSNQSDAIFTSFYCSSVASGESVIIDFACPRLYAGTTRVSNPYSYDNFVETIIPDCSGYGNDGTMRGTLVPVQGSARYDNCAMFDGDSHIIGSCVQNSQLTWNLWIKSTGATAHLVDCRTSDSVGYQPFYMLSGTSIQVGGNSAFPSISCPNVYDNQWHMLTLTVANATQTLYVDGVLCGSATSTDVSRGIMPVYIATRFSVSNHWKGDISDFRCYATVLSDSEILDLYHTSAAIDNTGNLFAFDFSEIGNDCVTKTGTVETPTINEHQLRVIDNDILVEPDGTQWLHIFHHNNPSSTLFSSSDTFTTGVYRDENRWFMMHLCNQFDTWEFIAVQKDTSNSSIVKYRWKQNYNPMTATFAQTTAANITKNTNGYSDMSSGGLYLDNSNCYLIHNNGTNGNWYGAVGCWTSWNSGIPGFNTSTCTTGSMDIYINMDGLQSMSKLTQIYQNNIQAKKIIEI